MPLPTTSSSFRSVTTTFVALVVFRVGLPSVNRTYLRPILACRRGLSLGFALVNARRYTRITSDTQRKTSEKTPWISSVQLGDNPRGEATRHTDDKFVGRGRRALPQRRPARHAA